VLFNSTVFLFIFAPVVYLVYWRVLSEQRSRLLLLTVASYAFYAHADWRFVFLLLGVTLLSYIAGARLHAATQAGDLAGRRRWLLIGVSGPLLLLAFFKYADFAALGVTWLIQRVVPAYVLPAPGILPPVGISFFIFRALSYIIDLYRGQAGGASDLLSLTAYIALFPHLIAGPITRYNMLAPQLEVLPQRLADGRLYNGLVIFVLGLAKKVLIADNLAAMVNPLLANYGDLQFIGAWGAMLGYTAQLYFDFSAYSEMAVGLGHWLGLNLPVNFNRPYLACNISEFWDRWHITLSSWLRDYLYIPLGGNRKGRHRQFLNLLITMFLGGLWHGAGWTFIAWGVYHGLLLVIYHAMRHRKLIRWRPLGWALTFAGVVFGWVLFRAETFEMAAHLSGSMLGLHGFEGLDALHHVLGFRLIGLILICAAIEAFVPPIPALGIAEEARGVPCHRVLTPAVQVVGLVVLFVAAVMSLDNARQFLYFRF